MRIELQEGYKLFSNQEGDLRLLCQNTHFANFSEMGAGKTLPSALLSKGVIDDNLCDYAIIVTPKIVLGDWHDVFKHQMVCNHQQMVLRYHAPRKIRPHMPLRPILIMTYETLIDDFEKFMTLARNKRVMITFDEAHKLKNHDSARTLKCTALAGLCKRVYLLTGSPITNGLKNAYSYINMLRPKQYYSSFESFKRQHMRYAKNNRRLLVGYVNADKIADILASFSVRHLKREIHDLPPITFETRYVPWDPKQKKLYLQFIEETILELENSWLEATNAGAMLVRSHQIITNPAQLNLPCESTRFKILEEDLESMGVAENKVVIFAHYRHTIEKLKKQLAHLNPAVIYGGTLDVEEPKRKFREDDSCRVMIANATSAGVGTNFSVAHFAIFFEYSYDLDNFDQAVSRLDRPGQKFPMLIVNYALRGTMEHLKILPALISKKQISVSALRDPAELIKFLSLVEDDEELAAVNF